MKKTVFAAVLALAAFGAVSAQQWGDPRFAGQTITVSGTLSFKDGMIAVEAEGGRYFAPSLARYAGFIADLKEGAQVTLEGFVSGNYVQPAAVTINGRRYGLYAGAPYRGRGNYRQGYAGYGGCCW
ncbi:MAG: hypothetical protein LBD13_03600 [Spirochaetaceae bacterium]|jgi:opacity protein-like surface antigen|nr:hypothetical protein [Spirochaetaceae bacterium]